MRQDDAGCPAADFRDRVVHHALCGVIGPILERRFIEDTFGCRVGKGAHRAVLRARHFARRFEFFAKLDIRRYFDSIDRDRLLSLLHGLFREKPLQRLLERIVRFPLPGQKPGKGLPIGNLTSQWFANFYLDEADRLVRERWACGGYIRYMDDLLLFDRSKDKLRGTVETLAEWLRVERGLDVKAEKVLLGPCRVGIPFLGWRVFPGVLRLQHGRYQRARSLIARREKDFFRGSIGEKGLTASVRAMCAGIQYLRPGFRLTGTSRF